MTNPGQPLQAAPTTITRVETGPAEPGHRTSEFGVTVALSGALLGLPVLGVPLSAWQQLALAILGAGYSLARAWRKFRTPG